MAQRHCCAPPAKRPSCLQGQAGAVRCAVQRGGSRRELQSLPVLTWRCCADGGWKDAAVQTMAAQLIENVRCDKAELVAMSHSTISIHSCSQLLGLTREQTVARCQSLGWGMQGDFIKPVRSAAVVSHAMSSDQLQSLTGTTFSRHRPSPPPLWNAPSRGVALQRRCCRGAAEALARLIVLSSPLCPCRHANRHLTDQRLPSCQRLWMQRH